MAGARRPNRTQPNRPGPTQGRPNQAPTNPYGAPQGQKGYGKDATYKMQGGQLTVGNKSGARSWLGSPNLSADQPGGAEALNQLGGSGVLAPMGKAKNGFMQFGYVPGAKEEGEAGYNVSGNKTPYAAQGMARAGFATNAGWDPKGKANTQAWNQMQGALSGTGGHMEFGQKGQDTGNGMRQNPRQGQGPQPGGMPGQGVPGSGGRIKGPIPGKDGGRPIVDPGFNTGRGPNPNKLGGGKKKGGGKKGGGNKGLPNLPPPQEGGGMVGGVGQMPQMPEPPDNFLPMTPGYEQDWRGLNDQLGAAESEFAQGQAMLPAAYNLQNTRLQNDQDLATKRLNEDLANRGVYTAKNAAGTYGGTSPSGGGVGETMYSRNVATPYGRQFQDLASQQAGAYNSLYGDYANANLGFFQGNNEALLNRANEAYELDPMGLANSGYQVPNMADPYFPFAPQGRPRSGKTRPRKNNNKKGGGKKGGKK